MPSSQVLVLYGTTDGHTRKVASAIAQTLRSDGIEAHVVNAAAAGRDCCPENYAAVIVAASVHAGGYQRAVRRWVRAHAVALSARPSAFVSVCLAVLERTPKADRELGAILEHFFAATSWRPDESKVVAGALLYTRYNFVKRWLMRRIVAKAHGDIDTTRDYEYTDWDDLASFVRRFLARLLAPARIAG